MRLTRPQARRTPTRHDRRAYPSRRLDRGYREEVRRLAFEADLAPPLKRHFLADPDVVSVEAFPEAFEWTDGLDGRELVHAPLMLVRWRGGATTYIDAMRRDRLVRDPEMGGTRARIEAECLARRAGYEVWTEREIPRPDGRVPVLDPANGRERSGHAASRRPAFPAAHHPLLHAVAARCGIDDLREVSGDWIGRDRLTGIPVVVLRGVRIDPDTRMAIWTPGRNAGPVERRKGSSRRALVAWASVVADPGTGRAEVRSIRADAQGAAS